MKRALLGFAALCVVVWIGVRAWARLPAYAPLTAGERDAILQRLRGRTDGPALSRVVAGPVVVTLWDRGAPAARVEGRGSTLGAAVDDAARALAAQPLDAQLRARARLKVDVVMARAPLVRWPAPLAPLAVVPGRDGVGLIVDEKEQLLLADDLLRDDLAAAHEPAPGMEFKLGLDVPATLDRLRTDAGLDPTAFRRAKKRWFRFRAEELVEPADHQGPALPVVRGNVPGPALTRENLRAAAVAGGRYLLQHLGADGRFDYEYWTARDQRETADYSIPRHAGGAWFLAQLYGATRDPAFLDGARRAIAWLDGAAPTGCHGAIRCVGDPRSRHVDLGSTALAVLALVQLRAATGETDHDTGLRGLVEFLLAMQKPDGDFCHLYDATLGKRDEKTKLLYYSGEAAFALARAAPLGDPRIPPALDRALESLTDRQYRPFALRFFFMEDHWTCMALDAGWDLLPADHRERYARFCDQFIAFLGRTQFHAGESVVEAQPDFAGAYGFSPFLPPHSTPVGSRSETTLSTLHLQERRGLPASVTAVTRRQIFDGMRFLLDRQIRDDGAWLMADPEASRGGFAMSDVARHIRIDFVQHACSAMLRAADLL
jgi:hypothetical protein